MRSCCIVFDPFVRNPFPAAEWRVTAVVGSRQSIVKFFLEIQIRLFAKKLEKGFWRQGTPGLCFPHVKRQLPIVRLELSRTCAQGGVSLDSPNLFVLSYLIFEIPIFRPRGVTSHGVGA